MQRNRQQTLSRPVTLDGQGVHSGEPARLTFQPAAPDSGIRFVRTDLPGRPEVRVELGNVVDTQLGTTLGVGEVRVRTVEHVLAALAALGIDNATLELDGPEPPIRDGSFLDFVGAIREAGIEEQDGELRVLTLTEPVTITLDGGESYVAVPAPDFRVSATIDFAHPAIGRRYGSFGIDAASFEADIAGARTFGFAEAAEALRAQGLALGSSLENTVVLDGNGVVNPGGLRFDDEFLRHKVGDLVGDLSLLGAPLRAHIVAERPSHRGNVALAGAIRERIRRSGTAAIVDAQQIMQYLPHRYPMLLVDRITDFEAGKRIVGLKNVTVNEPFFQGHYPGHPIMPGVLIIEAMAQVGGLLLMEAIENPEGKVVYFMTLDQVKWRRPVIPGDRIIFEVEMLQFRRQVCRMKGEAFVDGQVVAEAEFMARIVDR
jgi:UDP-3-O-[3-hydroxymyristoyl] N-acetylglucosamine deacetylase / 3-hydroxyacyl-[acyl-carrier-protein] dehydratase